MATIDEKFEEPSGTPRRARERDPNRSSRGYKELVVWQFAIRLVIIVYRLTAQFPADERFGLSSQMRRGSVSIASNIAEGYGRSTTGEFRQFLGIARGSCCELETQLIVAKMLGYGSSQTIADAERMLNSEGRLLHRYMESLGR